MFCHCDQVMQRIHQSERRHRTNNFFHSGLMSYQNTVCMHPLAQIVESHCLPDIALVHFCPQVTWVHSTKCESLGVCIVSGSDKPNIAVIWWPVDFGKQDFVKIWTQCFITNLNRGNLKQNASLFWGTVQWLTPLMVHPANLQWGVFFLMSPGTHCAWFRAT